MHRSARRAEYLSDSSRAARQQTRTRQRAEACRTTTTPPIDSVTSATSPAAKRPGGAARVLGLVPARARNHHHRSRPPLRAWARCTTVTVTGPPQRPRRRCPARDYATRVGDPPPPPHPAAAASRGRCRPGRVRAGPRGPLTSPHVADCRAATRAPRGAGSPDCYRHRRAGRRAPGRRRWGAVPGPRPPRWGPPGATFTARARRPDGHRVAGRCRDHHRAGRSDSEQARAEPA